MTQEKTISRINIFERVWVTLVRKQEGSASNNKVVQSFRQEKKTTGGGGERKKARETKRRAVGQCCCKIVETWEEIDIRMPANRYERMRACM